MGAEQAVNPRLFRYPAYLICKPPFPAKVTKTSASSVRFFIAEQDRKLQDF
jgi:hypothetical protein